MGKEIIKRLLQENGIAFEDLPPSNQFVNALRVEMDNPLNLQGLPHNCCKKCEKCKVEDCEIEDPRCWIYIIFNAAGDLLSFHAEIG